MKKLVVLSICVALVFCVSLSTSAIASDQEDVLQVEANFLKALSTKDYDLMSSLYWHSPNTSCFAPGNPPLLIQGWDESLQQYWKSIETATITSTLFLHPSVTMLKDDVAVINGYEYLVDTDSTTNEESTSRIRVTRVVQKIGGKWLIVSDHGSMLPEE